MEHRIPKDVCNIVYSYTQKYHHNEMMQELERNIYDIRISESYYEYISGGLQIIRCIKCKYWSMIPLLVSNPEYCNHCINLI